MIEILSYFDNFIINLKSIDLLVSFYCVLYKIIRAESKLNDYYYILEEKMLSILNKENYNMLFNDYIYNLIYKYKLIKKSNKNVDDKLQDISFQFSLLYLVSKIKNKGYSFKIILKSYSKIN